MERKIFYSKIDLWLVALLLAGVSPAILPLFWNFNWVLLGIDVLVLLFLADLFRNTKYEIVGKRLVVKSGILLRVSCDIFLLQSVSKTRTFLSAPALSLDRIKINVEGGGLLIVSPRQKQEFISALLAVNPNIRVLSDF